MLNIQDLMLTDEEIQPLVDALYENDCHGFEQAHLRPYLNTAATKALWGLIDQLRATEVEYQTGAKVLDLAGRSGKLTACADIEEALLAANIQKPEAK